MLPARVAHAYAKYADYAHLRNMRMRIENLIHIKLLESPIPTAAPTAAPAPSQKAHFALCIATKRGSIDPLVSKRPEKF